MNDISIRRNARSAEICLLLSGAKRGLFFPSEVIEWLQDEAIAWTVRGDSETIVFTIEDETERMLFAIRFAHLRVT